MQTASELDARALELFERAKQENDPEQRHILTAAAWHYARRAELIRVGQGPEAISGTENTAS